MTERQINKLQNIINADSVHSFKCVGSTLTSYKLKDKYIVVERLNNREKGDPFFWVGFDNCSSDGYDNFTQVMDVIKKELLIEL